MESIERLDKRQLRKKLLKMRQAMRVVEWQQKSLQICAHLRNSRILTQAQTILAYWSVRQEPDLSSLFTLNQTWGLPRCMGDSLIWHVWTADHSELVTGAYGIQEPRPDAPVLMPESVDLILVPAVACDLQGYRLGYGGGYYDRLFSQSQWQSKPAIAVLFEFARLPSLPIDPWDQPVQAIVTEAGLFYPNKILP